jgi:hypothetical protein
MGRVRVRLWKLLIGCLSRKGSSPGRTSSAGAGSKSRKAPRKAPRKASRKVPSHAKLHAKPHAQLHTSQLLLTAALDQTHSAPFLSFVRFVCLCAAARSRTRSGSHAVTSRSPNDDLIVTSRSPNDDLILLGTDTDSQTQTKMQTQTQHR